MLRTFCALLVASLSFTVSGGDLDVRLAITPNWTLPEVPVTVAVTITNAASTPVAFSAAFLQFDITSPDGGSVSQGFEIPEQYGGDRGFKRGQKYVLAPGQRIQLFFPPGGIDFTSPLFNDKNLLHQPGDYDLTVTVKGSGGRTAMSNSAHLSVAQPLGDDSAIWKAMNDPSLEGVHYAALTNFSCPTIRRYPNSQYYRLMAPWCELIEGRAAPGGSLEKYATVALEMGKALPPQGVDALRFEVGRLYAGAASNAYYNNKHAEAARFSNLGRTVGQELSDQASTDFGAVAGAWLKSQFHTETEWRALWDQMMRPRPEVAISPFVNCVSVSPDGTFSAVFGYENPNNHDMKRSRGEGNVVDAGPNPALGPTEFRPGRLETAFTVKGAKRAVTWTLDGKSATASIATSPRCEDLAVPR